MSELTPKQRQVLGMALAEVLEAARFLYRLNPESVAVGLHLVATCRRAGRQGGPAVTVEEAALAFAGLRRVCITLGPGAQDKIAALLEPVLDCADLAQAINRAEIGVHQKTACRGAGPVW